MEKVLKDQWAKVGEEVVYDHGWLIFNERKERFREVGDEQMLNELIQLTN